MDICTPAPGLPVLRAASERVVPQTSAYLQWLRASEQERPGGAGGSTHRLPLPLPLLFIRFLPFLRLVFYAIISI